jgi:hypothetical protein
MLGLVDLRDLQAISVLVESGQVTPIVDQNLRSARSGRRRPQPPGGARAREAGHHHLIRMA